MRILITNDDGIYAEGVLPLVKWAQTKGEVVVVAPKVEQSGKSHGIEIHKSFEAKQVDLLPGVTAWAVDSTPADCVRLAILGMHMDVDLVISGINRGLNIGRDIMYSGTVSAVFEAGNLGVNGLAVSTSPAYYADAATQMNKIWDYFVKYDLFSKNSMYNVNIPTGGSDCFRVTRQGGNYYSDKFSPQENDMFLPCGIDVFAPCVNSEFDTDAVLVDKVISVMPLTMDRTDLALYRTLKDQKL